MKNKNVQTHSYNQFSDKPIHHGSSFAHMRADSTPIQAHKYKRRMIKLRAGAITCFTVLSGLFCAPAWSQVSIVSDNFDDGNITSSPVWSNNTSKFLVSNSSPLEGAYSLRSNTANTPSSIYTQYGTNTNLTGANYTWTLLYRDNGSSNPDELPWGAAINSGNNHWRYWIGATSTDANNCDGFYISHSSGNLKFCRKLSSTWEIMTYPISLNTTYSIKINRRSDGYWYVYIDAGTGEASTQRWEGWATDVFNNGTGNIYTVLQCNETTSNRFQWDRAGLSMKSLTISQLTQGIATGDMEEGMTNKAVFGFSATASGGNITLKEVYIANTNSNNGGTFTNMKLYTSVDNDYSTAGDNTVVGNAVITLNGTKVDLQSLSQLITSGTTKNYFLVTDIAVNTSGSTPPASMQFSLACNNCGASNTNVVTENGEKVNDFSFSGTNYNFLRVFTWRNTSTVGDYTDDWQNASAWEPYRNSPSATDILKFSKGGSVTPLNVPTETMKRLVITGNTTVNINTTSLTNGTRTFTLGGGSDDDFVIDAGSTLNVTSTGNILNINLPNGTTASVSGAINLSGKNHTISAPANSFLFKSGSTLTCGTGVTTSPFTNSTNNSVLFLSGSTLIDPVNIDYTATGKITFQPGSNYKITFNAVPYFNGRVYANVEINNAAFNQSISGVSGFAMDNLTITAATTVNITNSGSKLIGGNLTVTSGTLNINPSSASSLTFNKNGTQTISGAGTLTFGSNCNITINNTSNVSLSKDISIPSALTLNGKITINTQILTLSGTITGTGVLTGSSTSDISIGGTGNFGTLYFDQTSSTTRTIRNFTLNRASGGTVTLGNALELKNVFTLTAGTFASGGNLTLISDANGTARIPAITSGSITGNVIAQRYIPGGAGKRRYRTLSSPVNVSGSIAYSQLIDDTYITNPGAPANGFDQSPQQNSSAYTYDETVTGGMNIGWVTPTNVTNTIPTGRGIMITIRGDRNTPDPFSPSSTPNNCTIDYIGTINTGNISPAITYTNTGNITNDGWNLIGNPYPSPITWTSGITKSGVSSTIYIYNPNTGTYGSYNGIVGTNGVTQYIASGQAFFIKTTSANPSITFSESCKTSNTPSNMFRNGLTRNQLSLTFYKDSINSDETLLFMGDSTTKAYQETEDAMKFMNGTINIYTKSSDNIDLAINSYSMPQSSDTIPVIVSGAIGNYELRIKDIASFDAGVTVYLLDKFTDNIYTLGSDTTIAFAISSNAASQGTNRFKIVFNKSSAPLPVTLLNFTGKIKDQKTELQWTTASEINNSHFTIEKSRDGKLFETIATVSAATDGTKINNYFITDNNPYTGINYYRLNQFDKNGKMSLSKIISVENLHISNSTLNIYPNPVANTLNIHLGETDLKDIVVEIISITGKTVFASSYQNPSSVLNVNCENFPNGIYLVKINSKGKIETLTFSKN